MIEGETEKDIVYPVMYSMTNVYFQVTDSEGAFICFIGIHEKDNETAKDVCELLNNHKITNKNSILSKPISVSGSGLGANIEDQNGKTVVFGQEFIIDFIMSKLKKGAIKSKH
jgi:hypothetical protein